jgi:hypothetical protein
MTSLALRRLQNSEVFVTVHACALLPTLNVGEEKQANHLGGRETQAILLLTV